MQVHPFCSTPLYGDLPAMSWALTPGASVASPAPLGQLQFVEKTISTTSVVCRLVRRGSRHILLTGN